MILWSMIICAMAGFILGVHCRLLPLVAASALVVASRSLMQRTDEATLLSDGFTIFGLLAILQAFFLAGAVWRIFGPRVPLYDWRSFGAARSARRLAMRSARAGD